MKIDVDSILLLYPINLELQKVEFKPKGSCLFGSVKYHRWKGMTLKFPTSV